MEEEEEQDVGAQLAQLDRARQLRKSRGRAPAPEVRSAKRERFVRLANSRMTKVLNELRVLGHLSNTGNYDYGPKDVEKIFDRLEEKLAQLRSRFEVGKEEEEDQFSLEDD